MTDVFFIILFVLLLGAPGIIWLFAHPPSSFSYYWMAPLAISILVILFGGAALNMLAGWPAFWGFFIVWASSCILAWWVPTYQRNRKGRIAAALRTDVEVNWGQADTPVKRSPVAEPAGTASGKRKSRHKRKK